MALDNSFLESLPVLLQQCVNASLALCEMIRLSRKMCHTSGTSDSTPHPLNTLMESKDLIEQLLNNVFASEKPSNTLVISGVSVLLMILRDE